MRTSCAGAAPASRPSACCAPLCIAQCQAALDDAGGARACSCSNTKPCVLPACRGICKHTDSITQITARSGLPGCRVMPADVAGGGWSGYHACGSQPIDTTPPHSSDVRPAGALPDDAFHASGVPLVPPSEGRRKRYQQVQVSQHEGQRRSGITKSTGSASAGMWSASAPAAMSPRH